ncbi:ArsA family ATPase [bacterium]|nr:ArsA family ATPase [bacterium]
MPHKTLFSRRLLFITGKGGVGKTTIAASLAVAARDRGMRVLLVEVGVTENLGQLFHKWIPVYNIATVEDDLDVLRLDPYLAFQDYLAQQMKFEWAAKKFLETDVIRALLQAAPGWRELITLGKIWTIEQAADKRTGKPEYDLIVVDAPATGHGVGFFRVPRAIIDTFKYGPIRHHTQEVQKLLLDPHRTLLNVVTLPEEMPMNEACEMFDAARDQLLMPFGFVFINMMPQKVLTPAQQQRIDALAKDGKALAALDAALPGGHERLLAAGRREQARRKLAEGYVTRAKKRIDAEFVELPYLYQEAMNRDGLSVLARAIEEAGA